MCREPESASPVGIWYRERVAEFVCCLQYGREPSTRAFVYSSVLSFRRLHFLINTRQSIRRRCFQIFFAHHSAPKEWLAIYNRQLEEGRNETYQPCEMR